MDSFGISLLPSAGWQHVPKYRQHKQFLISIHALRGEGDLPRLYFHFSHNYFNPRPPRGGRLSLCQLLLHIAYYFNPRPPRGGRPVDLRDYFSENIISIHALRGEGDPCPFSSLTGYKYFNPRPPRGGRLPQRRGSGQINQYFNPRPPRGGRHVRSWRTWQGF